MRPCSPAQYSVGVCEREQSKLHNYLLILCRGSVKCCSAVGKVSTPGSRNVTAIKQVQCAKRLDHIDSYTCKSESNDVKQI